MEPRLICPLFKDPCHEVNSNPELERCAFYDIKRHDKLAKKDLTPSAQCCRIAMTALGMYVRPQ